MIPTGREMLATGTVTEEGNYSDQRALVVESEGKFADRY